MSRIWPFRSIGLKAISVAWPSFCGWLSPARNWSSVACACRSNSSRFLGLEMRGEPPTLVDVRVRGSSGALSRMSTADVVAVLDLHTARPGQRLFQLTPEQVRVPFGVEVLQVTPATVAMVFEEVGDAAGAGRPCRRR